MAVRKESWGWIVDFWMKYPDGDKDRVREKSPIQSRRGAEAFERDRRAELMEQWKQEQLGLVVRLKKEVPTFTKWWDGRFWRERVVGERNGESEKEAKRSIYKNYLKERFGQLPLDVIVNDGHLPDFRATLVEKVDKGALSEKTVNNILSPLRAALRYAADQGVIANEPRIKGFKIEPPEVVWWEFKQYARILAAAQEKEPFWYVPACLTGEAGLRIGEVRALIWERDVDLIAWTITVQRQCRKGKEGKPKGKKRRTIPMTATLHDALLGLDVVRRGYVARNTDGSPLRDGQTTHAMPRVCRKAGLDERGWHTMRRSFATHAALFGVNPWRLMAWLGHKSIEQTMRYVHVAEDHRRPIPPECLEAGDGEADPDLRIIKMLGARKGIDWKESGQQAGQKLAGFGQYMGSKKTPAVKPA